MQYRESISQGHYEEVNLFCEVQILATSIQLHLLHTKDTESHEDSDFCYDWGVRMCDFCRNKKKIIDGKGNLVLFGAENNMIFDNSDGKEVAGAVKINFCPICGRKLVEYV